MMGAGPAPNARHAELGEEAGTSGAASGSMCGRSIAQRSPSGFGEGRLEHRHGVAAAVVGERATIVLRSSRRPKYASAKSVADIGTNSAVSAGVATGEHQRGDEDVHAVGGVVSLLTPPFGPPGATVWTMPGIGPTMTAS